MNRRKAATPVRSALKPRSSLLSSVRDGIRAVKRADVGCLDESVRRDFADSLDLDGALRAEHPGEHRWDYLLGHAPSQEVVALEPHTAHTQEVSVVIQKKKAAKDQLRPHLASGAQVSKWLWVASGKTEIAAMEKANRQLDQKGITFVGRKVLARHLPAAAGRDPGGSRKTEAGSR